MKQLPVWSICLLAGVCGFVGGRTGVQMGSDDGTIDGQNMASLQLATQNQRRGGGIVQEAPQRFSDILMSGTRWFFGRGTVFR